MINPALLFGFPKKTSVPGSGQALNYIIPALFVCCLVLSVLSVCDIAAAESLPDADDSRSQCPVAGSEDDTLKFSIPPFLSIRETDEWREFSFVPFYFKRETADDSEKRHQFLWPFFLYKRYDRDLTVRVLPVYTYWRDIYEYRDGEEYESYYMLFPFLYGGYSSEYGKSFALFPIYGDLNNFLGRDEIRFRLFPLYMEYSKNELHQRNYLWPVLSFSDGGDYNGFRFWPLYGKFERKGEFRNEFWLWPIFHRQTFNLDTDQIGRRILILPFYAGEDSTRRRYRSVLWPFFTREQNFARDFEQYSAPWPFIVMEKGSRYRNQIWPLYGFRKTEDSQTRFLLWPFWQQREYGLGDESKVKEARLLPFWSSETEFSGSREVRHKSRFWPLWRFRRAEDGSTRLRLLSLLWFDDEIGFDRHYAPLWTIYKRETDGDGASCASALWGLYRRADTPVSSESRIPLLYSSIKDEEESLRETKILGGLFGARTEGEQRSIRILYFLQMNY